MSKKNFQSSVSNAEDTLSFGRYLKSARHEKGIPLANIASEMRVPEMTLRFLEEESHESLPDEVFVKGFVRAYAQIVGINTDEAVQRYLASRHQYLQSLQFEKRFLKSGQTFWPRLLLVIGTLVAIMLVSILALHNLNGSTDTKHETAEISKPKETNTTAESGIKIPHSELPETKSSQSYLLRVKTVEATWLKIIIDRQEPKEYSLSPGDRLELKATKEFNLLVGNATGIHLHLNEKPVPIDGKHGQVVSLKIP